MDSLISGEVVIKVVVSVLIGNIISVIVDSAVLGRDVVSVTVDVVSNKVDVVATTVDVVVISEMIDCTALVVNCSVLLGWVVEVIEVKGVVRADVTARLGVVRVVVRGATVLVRCVDVSVLSKSVVRLVVNADDVVRTRRARRGAVAAVGASQFKRMTLTLRGPPTPGRRPTTPPRRSASWFRETPALRNAAGAADVSAASGGGTSDAASATVVSPPSAGGVSPSATATVVSSAAGVSPSAAAAVVSAAAAVVSPAADVVSSPPAAADDVSSPTAVVVSLLTSSSYSCKEGDGQQQKIRRPRAPTYS